jgi:uncharacterized protein YecE (DUF72 family)
MAGDIRVGTSGWHYPGGKGTWNGPFYPATRPRGFDELRFYAERFDTVEVNTTFYRQPDASMCQKWLDRTPASFLFSAKLYQKFTHPEMYVKRPGVQEWDVTPGDLDEFRRGIAPLADAGRLGALLLQFPSSFHAEPHTRDYLAWLLEAFRDYPRAVELRHASWSKDRDATASLVTAAGASLVQQDEPFQPLTFGAAPTGLGGATPASGALTYIRLHGRNKAQWWEHEHPEDRYNYLYSDAELEPVSDFAKEEAALEKRVLVYFNNHFSAKAVANADILKNQLGQLAPTWELRPPAP